MSECAVDCDQKLLGSKGFGEVIVGSSPDGSDCSIERGVCRDENHGHIWILFATIHFEQFDAADSGIMRSDTIRSGERDC